MAEAGPDGFAAAWLRARGLVEAADILERRTPCDDARHS
jgi:hypothetical protein